MNLAYNFGEAVRFLALHPELGQVVVEAYCGLEAKIAAAIAWDVPYEKIAEGCKVGVDKEALRRIRNVGERNVAEAAVQTVSA